MLKLCENGSNIDYLYETSSVLRKATETEISGLTFWLRFGSGLKKNKTEPKFGFHKSLFITCKNFNADFLCVYCGKLIAPMHSRKSLQAQSKCQSTKGIKQKKKHKKTLIAINSVNYMIIPYISSNYDKFT